MIRLRHLSDESLKRLEERIEALKTPVMMLGVNHVGTNWYAHFVVVEGRDDISESKPLFDMPVTKVKKTKSRSK